MQVETTVKLSRTEILNALTKRDGTTCQYPDCGRELDFSVADDSDPRFITIDHWMPQFYGKANGWTYEQIWDLSNLKLMHKSCNARKADRIPNEDGTIPARKVREFRYRRQKRAGRPELCTACDNGHGLGMDEICANCGCTAKRLPRWAKVPFPECDHAAFWCWVCSITPDMRASAVEMMMLHGEGGEVDAE